MSESRNEPTCTAQRSVRAQWQRPEARRTRAGAAEMAAVAVGADVVWS